MASEWCSYLLDDVCDFTNGFAFKRTDYVEPSSETVEVFRMGYIERGGGFKEDSTPVFVPRDYGRNLDKFMLQEGDVTIAMTDMKDRVAILANTARIRESGRFVLNQRVGCIRVKRTDVLDPRFFYFYSNSSPHVSYLRSRANRGVQVNLSTSAIKESELLIPPLAEQKSIAHILGSLDDKIELNREMNVTLESMARALFKSWFVDFDPVIDKALAAGNPIPEPLSARAQTRRALAGQTKPLPDHIQKLFPDAFQFDEEMGWIPDGWEVTDFGSVSKCFDRKRIPLSKKQREEKKPGTIPYHGATSVMDYIDEWIFDDVFLLIGEDGSVIKEDGTPFIQYIWGKSWVNNHAHVLQGARGISTEHLMQFIAAQNMTAYVTGAVQPKINQKNMNSIPFLLADSPLNSEFAEQLEPIYSRFKQNFEEQATLTKLRDTLLPQLLSGSLRVPDAEQLVADSL
jgi:type I restriction enzyme S subunit